VYTANPLAGIIDAFQSSVLHASAPDLKTLLPGMVITGVLLPMSYAYFRHAEDRFADVI
jgi:lipopolysaccharide transport system permease protein